MTLPEPTFTEALHWSGLIAPLPLDIPLRRPPSRRPRLVQGRQVRAYAEISRFEDELRQFIDDEMTERFGPAWTKQRVSGDARERWKKRRGEAVADGEEELPLIYYADFGDYVGLLTCKDNWKDVFGDVFKSQKDLEVSLERLQPMRRCTMHARPLLKYDVLTVVVEVRRLRIAIGTDEKD